MARILVAKTSFSCEIDGKHCVVTKGMTVREGHPILASREEYFEPFVVDLEHTPAATRSTSTRKAN